MESKRVGAIILHKAFRIEWIRYVSTKLSHFYYNEINKTFCLVNWHSIIGLEKIAEVLIEHGTNLDHTNEHGNTPLILAAMNGELTQVLSRFNLNLPKVLRFIKTIIVWTSRKEECCTNLFILQGQKA